jgi:hypothetical protein
MSTKKHPQWWQLYVMLPVLVGLFWPETRAALTQTEHVIAELGILALIFGFTHLWLRANRSALAGSDPAEFGWGVKLYEIPPHQQDAAEEDGDRASLRRDPGTTPTNIKGVLADTFEWDFPENDARVFAGRTNLSQER